MGIKSFGNNAEDFVNKFLKARAFDSTGLDAASPEPALSGLTATGGVISDYTDGSTVYRAHIFTSSGTFAVNSIGNFGSNVEFLVVAGGGGGGGTSSSGGGRGGGGAGGLRSNHPQMPAPLIMPASSLPVSTSPGSYAIEVGAGGVGSYASSSPEESGTQGGNSSIANPNITTITANGGGLGSISPGQGPKTVGGSGGGDYSSPGGFAGNSPPTSPPQGNPGSAGSNNTAGGGGGAGGTAPAAPSQAGGIGGPGLPLSITGITTHYAGGGGGGGSWNSSPGVGGAGGLGGGGAGSDRAGTGSNGIHATGGGGGGTSGNNAGSGGTGGNGGSGIVVVRYQIAQLTATAKATGGAISFYGGKTIHTFTSSGDFNVTNGPIDVSYVVVAGGGSGGFDGGGGGGAGGVLTNIPGLMPTTQPSLTLSNGPVAVQVGAGGASIATDSQSPNGSDSYFGSPRTATGGGGGGYNLDGNGRPGGSGGGERINRSLSAGNGTPGQGNPGFNDGPGSYGGGGGGAGTGGPGSVNNGGAGVQMPSIFRDPISRVGFPGPGGGNYWLAGGGGGYGDSNAPKGGGPGGPYAGAGDGGGPGGTGAFGALSNAQQNSGSGGGGGSGQVSPYRGGAGGSGIVLIAYPS